MPSKIIVKNLKKSFGSLEVLKDINMDVEEGEVVCLIGPSGSGKSTFLRCLNRLEDITSGVVTVDGHLMSDRKININKVRENIGKMCIRDRSKLSAGKRFGSGRMAHRGTAFRDSKSFGTVS